MKNNLFYALILLLTLSLSACGSTDPSINNNCGNGTLDNGEKCDGNLFENGLSCASATNNAKPNGNLSCSNSCTVITDNCSENTTQTCDTKQNWFGKTLTNATHGTFDFDAGLSAIKSTIMASSFKQDINLDLQVQGAVVTAVDGKNNQYAYIQDQNAAVYIRLNGKSTHRFNVGDKISFTAKKGKKYYNTPQISEIDGGITVDAENQEIKAIDLNQHTVNLTDDVFKFVTFQGKIKEAEKCGDQSKSLCGKVKSFNSNTEYAIYINSWGASSIPQTNDCFFFAGPLNSYKDKPQLKAYSHDHEWIK